ncbi:MAG: type IV pili twitching motility protein PilT [Gammaproteobacteria bacterium]|nr:MAG: type IV pili twitching motility protein PilT [Gammaproteobacteria bacterium]
MTPQEANQLISKLAVLLNKQKGSDIIINAHAHPALKVDGKVRYVKDVMLSSDDAATIVKCLMSSHQWEKFDRSNEMNFMLDYPGVAQFRTNAFKQRGEMGLVMRLIPKSIPTLEQLKLPEILKDFALRKRGLILFSGATGAGKSTSLAAMISYRNENRSDHIITVEDPIEFIHTNKKSIITQREVGIDTESYSSAMKSALRQAPDVVLVGEIRDADVMHQAMAFAETGHLVFATVHATTTKLTLERIVNFFPHEQRDQLMLDLSSNLQAIVTQRLMLHASGSGRVAAVEVLSNTPHMQLLIRESRFGEITDAMSRASLKEGVITIDNYIFDLYEKGEVTFEEALHYVESPNNFRIRMRTDSKRALPESLKSEVQDWGLEKAAADENEEKTWGTFG